MSFLSHIFERFDRLERVIHGRFDAVQRKLDLIRSDIAKLGQPRPKRLVPILGRREKQTLNGQTEAIMSDLSVALADDEQVGVTFSEVDDRGNAVDVADPVTMSSDDPNIATIGTLHDGTTPAIVAAGKVGACTVQCRTQGGLSATIAVAVGTSSPVGLSAAFGSPEKQ